MSENGTTYPDEMTPALKDVLTLMIFITGPIADVLRRGGHEIKRKAEDEQAFVLHWLIKIALKHGDGWHKVANAELDAIREKLTAARPL